MDRCDEIVKAARSVGGSDLDLGWRAGASEFEDVGKTSRDENPYIRDLV